MILKNIGIISISNGFHLEKEEIIKKLLKNMEKIGLKGVLSSCLYEKNSPFSGSPEERGFELMKFFKDKSISAIFDVSGGDSANQILPFLDFEIIKENPKDFFGLSDLSVLLNAIYTKTNLKTYYFQARNLIEEEQLQRFKSQFIDKTLDFNTFPYKFIRGKSAEGIIVGGNIRCFLKLAGTKYFPDLNGKILLLESLGGEQSRIASLLAQLEQIGAFKKVKAILLGTFTTMEKNNLKPRVSELLKELSKNYDFPIIKTNKIGHHKDAHCISIGSFMSFKSITKKVLE